jgi:hypothetical protein
MTARRAPKPVPKWAAAFYRFPDLRSAGVLLSRSRLNRLQQVGDFPRPLSRPGDHAYYPREEVDAWVAKRRALIADVMGRRAVG